MKKNIKFHVRSALQRIGAWQLPAQPLCLPQCGHITLVHTIWQWDITNQRWPEYGKRAKKLSIILQWRKFKKIQIQVFPQQAALVAGDNGLPALYSDVSEVLWYLYKSLGHLAPQSTACTHTLQSMIYGCVWVYIDEREKTTNTNCRHHNICLQPECARGPGVAAAAIDGTRKPASAHGNAHADRYCCLGTWAMKKEKNNSINQNIKIIKKVLVQHAENYYIYLMPVRQASYHHHSDSTITVSN